MAASIDEAGRLVIPKAIRTAAQLLPCKRVEFQVLASRQLETTPVPLSASLERKGRLVVALPKSAQHPSAQSVVEDTIA